MFLIVITVPKTIRKRPMKAFIRIDGSGRDVPNSLIWRKSIPKVGKWKEVDGYDCCSNEPAVN